MPKRSPHAILKSVFGYSSFRGHQEDAIATVLEGKDALVLMPTGAGKSLCYQIPSLVRDGVGVVISPLIALMQDQVAALQELGVSAAFLNSSQTLPEARKVEQQLLRGELDLLYVAPERLVTPFFLQLLEQSKLALFAIDEAHCVSQWGHDFRPEYLKLDLLREKFPDVPRIALTATADKTTQKEIVLRLHLSKARVFASGFDRPNIQYRIIEKQSPKKQLLSFLRSEHAKDAGIVYCLSRRSVDDTAEWLRAQGFKALPYHAGLASEVRQKNQTYFLQNDGVIMVATIAFGMGIDKPNVRFVAHLDMPKSIEAYYQETGRAGRDGLPATAWLAYGLQDVMILRQMLATGNASLEQKQVEKRKLDAMLGLCETSSCRRQALLNYFNDPHSGNCGNCDMCLNPVESWDGTKAAQKALSCVFRTRQLFGVQHLIDVLCGKETEKTLRFDHHLLSVFGIGKDMKPDEWRSVYHQLIAMGFLHVDIASFGALKLTTQAGLVLKGEKNVMLRKTPKKLPKAKTKKSAKESDVVFSPQEGTLLDEMKALRLQLSREHGVPPYVIFHDRTLMEIAHKRPKDLEELRGLYGVGEHKLTKYGQAFLRVIEGHA